MPQFNKIQVVSPAVAFKLITIAIPPYDVPIFGYWIADVQNEDASAGVFIWRENYKIFDTKSRKTFPLDSVIFAPTADQLLDALQLQQKKFKFIAFPPEITQEQGLIYKATFLGQDCSFESKNRADCLAMAFIWAKENGA